MFEKIYTQDELKRINDARTAIPGHRYIDTWGNNYIGTSYRKINSLAGTSAVWGNITGNISDQTDIVDLFATKQDLLVSGVNIKTINGNSLLGSGDIVITGGSQDLNQVLTIGNDGGGQDIANVAGLQDSAFNRSIDIQNRQLIVSSGLVWTVDWENKLLSDSVGQQSIDWENRLLVDNLLTTKFDWQNLQMPTLGGSGAGYVAVDNLGNLSWGAGSTPQDLQSVTNVGNVTTNTIEAAAFITTGGTDEDFVLGDGTLSDIKKNRVINTVAMGLISGGQLSINGGDNTKFDISAGKGIIIDNYTDADNPVIYPVTFGPFTAVTVTNLGTQTTTYVLIDNAGAIVQMNTPPDSEDHRDYIFLGQLGHANLTNIQTATNYPEVSIAPSDQLRDLEDAIGIINFGNTISANGANLNLNKSSGSFVKSGVNFHTNNKAPGVKTYASGTAITFRRRTQTGNGASGVNTLDVGNYDVGGVITPIVGTKFQNQRVFLTIAGNVVIQYGQNVYNSMSEAIQNIQYESFVIFANLTEVAALIGIITVRSSATTLNNSAQARFFTVSKFGELVGAASGTSVSTLQNAYDNSTTPEIVTDSTRGAVTVKRGSAADTDDVIDVLNGGGTKTFAVTGEGEIESDQVYLLMISQFRFLTKN